MNTELGFSVRLPSLLAVLAAGILVLSSVAGVAPAKHDALDAAPRSIPISITEPALNAHAYLVRLVGSPAPLIGRRAWKRMAPASLTKLMTAAIAEEALGKEELVLFSVDAKATEEKTSKIGAGETFLRDDAIRLALIASANDAAMALAEAVGKEGGIQSYTSRIERFVARMNESAVGLGLRDTHFANPTGLDQEGHFASAEDLAQMSEYLFLRHPRLWEISRTNETVIYSSLNRAHTVGATNELLKEFPAILGGKTGFTDRALGTLILLYPVRSNPALLAKLKERDAAPLAGSTSGQVYPVRPDRVAIIVILGSEDRFGDGRAIIRWLEANFGS